MKEKVKSISPRVFFIKDINRLEHDAVAQYKFNRFWAAIWFCTLITIPFVPTLYAHSVSVLIVQEVSLWANFATHFGAMSGALAAMNTSKRVNDISDDVDDIHEVTERLDDLVPDTWQPDQSILQ